MRIGLLMTNHAIVESCVSDTNLDFLNNQQDIISAMLVGQNNGGINSLNILNFLFYYILFILCDAIFFPCLTINLRLRFKFPMDVEASMKQLCLF